MQSETKVKTFLKRLESELEKRGWSGADFARAMGVPKGTVYRWLNGTKVISMKKYYKALEVLGLEENLIPKKAQQPADIKKTA